MVLPVARSPTPRPALPSPLTRSTHRPDRHRQRPRLRHLLSGTSQQPSGTAPATAVSTTVTGFSCLGLAPARPPRRCRRLHRYSNCTNVAISNGGAASCTITNTQTSTTFTVNKVYSPAGPATSVPVSVTCSSGTPSPASGNASVPATGPSSTTVTGFASASTCTASEAVPAGYVATSNCTSVAISNGGAASCTITNTQTSTTFTVNKVYSPAGPAASVPVSVTCSSGTPSPASGNASPATAFSTTVTGFAVSGSTCTATETVPSGYVATSNCTGVAISNGGAASCTITNTLNGASLTVHKNFSDNSSASVTVSVTCTNGGTPAPASSSVSQASPGSFSITGFTSGATCTATETVPAGYTASSNCTNVAISNGGAASCTITNTATSTTFTVNKVYSPAGPAASVPVSVTCSSGTPSPASGNASPATAFSTTVTGFAASGSTCTATEDGARRQRYFQLHQRRHQATVVLPARSPTPRPALPSPLARSTLRPDRPPASRSP